VKRKPATRIGRRKRAVSTTKSALAGANTPLLHRNCCVERKAKCLAVTAPGEVARDGSHKSGDGRLAVYCLAAPAVRNQQLFTVPSNDCQVAVVVLGPNWRTAMVATLSKNAAAQATSVQIVKFMIAEW